MSSVEVKSSNINAASEKYSLQLWIDALEPRKCEKAICHFMNDLIERHSFPTPGMVFKAVPIAILDVTLGVLSPIIATIELLSKAFINLVGAAFSENYSMRNVKVCLMGTVPRFPSIVTKIIGSPVILLLDVANIFYNGGIAKSYTDLDRHEKLIESYKNKLNEISQISSATFDK